MEEQEPEMSEKPGRDSRKELLLESDTNAGRTGRVRLRKHPFHLASMSALIIRKSSLGLGYEKKPDYSGLKRK